MEAEGNLNTHLQYILFKFLFRLLNYHHPFFIDIIKKNNIFQVKIPCFETKNKRKSGQNKQKQNLVNKNNMDI